MEEAKKNNNTVFIVVIVVLLLICCGMGAFIFMNKDKLSGGETGKSSVEEIEKETEESAELTTEAKERIERFIDAATTLNYGSGLIAHFINGATTLPQDVKYKLVTQALHNENKVEKNHTITSEEANNLEGITPGNNEIANIVKMTDYNEMYESLFNEEAKYDVSGSSFYGCPFIAAVNKDKTQLYFYHRCGGAGASELERTITSIEQEGDYFVAHQKIIEKNTDTGETNTILLKWKFDKNINFVSDEKE